ncbi:hypothetical protein BOTBODRAFT_66279, partial [Botryobasidium botryosum FD-172 SS1]
MATAAAIALPPGDIHTTSTTISPIPPDNLPLVKTNTLDDPRPAIIHSVRGREHAFSLDTNGFAFVKHTSAKTEFLDDKLIESRYYTEVEEILKAQCAESKRICIFDHTIRSTPRRVHADQTFDAGPDRVRYHLGDEAERLLQGRVRIINVWRPIGSTVHRDPLAIADWRTIDVENDLVSTKSTYPDRTGGFCDIRYNKNLEWYYLKEQTTSEVALIKCFDSSIDGRARLAPHSSFHDDSLPPDAPERQSTKSG